MTGPDIKELAAGAARAAGEATAEIAWANMLDGCYRDSAFASRMRLAREHLRRALADMDRAAIECANLPARPIVAAPQ